MEYFAVRAMLDEIGVPECWPPSFSESKILVLMKPLEKFESFGSPFRSSILTDGKYRKTGQADEFIEHKIVGASYIVQFGYGTDGVRGVYIYPHCDLVKLCSVLLPLVEQWREEVVRAEVHNALWALFGPIRL